MPHTLRCLRCGHEDAGAEPLTTGIFRCTECGALHAYGTLVPRIVIRPAEDDARFVEIVHGQAGAEHVLRIDRDVTFVRLARELVSLLR